MKFNPFKIIKKEIEEARASYFVPYAFFPDDAKAHIKKTMVTMAGFLFITLLGTFAINLSLWPSVILVMLITLINLYRYFSVFGRNEFEVIDGICIDIEKQGYRKQTKRIFIQTPEETVYRFIIYEKRYKIGNKIRVYYKKDKYLVKDGYIDIISPLFIDVVSATEPI